MFKPELRGQLWDKEIVVF